MVNVRRDRVSNVRRIESQYVEEQVQLQELLAKRKRGVIRRLSFFSAIVVVFVCFTAFTISNQNDIIQEQQETKARLQEQLNALKKEEKELMLEIENLHDPEYIADIARRDYYLTNPGETLFPLPRKSSDN